MRWLTLLALLTLAVAEALGENGEGAPKRFIDHGPLVQSLDAWTFWPAIAANDKLVFVKFYTEDCRCEGLVNDKAANSLQDIRCEV
jgi:hypothetical protein